MGEFLVDVTLHSEALVLGLSSNLQALLLWQVT